jgi:phosphoinositide-3-kinase regulatory subunit 4
VSFNTFVLWPIVDVDISDVEETVVARVLAALTSLCELGLFQKMRIWELMSATLGFLYHPNVWIRQGIVEFYELEAEFVLNASLGATSFITSAAQHLPSTDVWCILYPSLKHYMKSDVVSIDERSLLTVLECPVS